MYSSLVSILYRTCAFRGDGGAQLACFRNRRVPRRDAYYPCSADDSVLSSELYFHTSRDSRDRASRVRAASRERREDRSKCAFPNFVVFVFTEQLYNGTRNYS